MKGQSAGSIEAGDDGGLSWTDEPLGVVEDQTWPGERMTASVETCELTSDQKKVYAEREGEECGE